MGVYVGVHPALSLLVQAGNKLSSPWVVSHVFSLFCHRPENPIEEQ